ncbi:phosphodiesterase [Plantactinospora sp. S1510]|uniref:Phosphodiesterase n=1 Tax=Plantactinospora alkalitolerans TaxID=2789879 RepID=A0ABS0H591_9ACTN|nr:phosphodiesterase [Plantactinospora alkalitolerans]MBF9133655.1 phosphodiesterase [Plantactinospora alkalitolerans]
MPDPRVAGRLARWRGGRLLHPRGLSFTGQVELWGPLAVRMAGGAGRCAGTVRLSRGTPTPDGWPDVLGLAVRLHGRAGPFDLLLSTSSQRRVLRHVPIPRYDFAGPYGSLVGYRIDNRRVYVAARSSRPLGRTLDEVASVADRDAACLDLFAVGGTGPWRRFGRVVFGARLPAEVDAALAFDPDGCRGSALRPTGLIQRLRGAGYAFSQRSRGAAADQTRLP